MRDRAHGTSSPHDHALSAAKGTAAIATRLIELIVSPALDRPRFDAQYYVMATSERVRKLLVEAAALPDEERAELVDELARTISYGADEDDVDYDELDRRMESVRSGTAPLVSWEDARKQLLGE